MSDKLNEYAGAERVKAIAAYEAGGKAINAFVASSLTAYAKLSVRLHLTACVAVHFLMEHGQNGPINSFLKGLRKNDQDALRVWVGHLGSIVGVNDDGEEYVKKFIVHNKDEGFKVIKGHVDHLPGKYTLVELFNLRSFMDVDQSAEKKFDIAAILAMLAKLEKTNKTKAENAGVVLPKNLSNFLHLITVEAIKLSADPSVIGVPDVVAPVDTVKVEGVNI